MVLIIHLEVATFEELFAKRIASRVLGVPVVIVEGLLENIGTDTNLLRQLLARVELLHQASAHIVFEMPFNLLAGGAVENKPNRKLHGG